MNITILLKQHIGKEAKPIVKIGEEVKKGQLIAMPQGLGANIHSSVFGKVIEIDDSRIIIEAYEDQSGDYVKIKDTKDNLEAIQDAGIVGAGGAGFPAHIKFNANLEGGCIIVNAAECEPTLNHNILLLEENPDIVIRGLKIVMEITNAARGYIAIKPIHKKALIAVAKACRNEENIEVKFLPNMYPAGDERVIVRELLGIVLNPGQLPIEANAIISNVETLKNVALAIDERKPVITKDITVGGRLRNASKGKVFFDVPIGIPVNYYIKECGGYIEPYGEIVIGGPFTGKHGEESTPITKTVGGILVSMPFPREKRKIGVIACECGAQEKRLEEIAHYMGGEVIATTKCKRMIEVNGRYRCDKPGTCPGQAEKVLYLKKQGAEVVLTGTCQD
ncbi:proline reductase-associated electron transfer protein PrdC [Paramaledivibacter caminithermalis DSM 15212]|jgi:proline reductase-associated electron transfer protein PrdC|uniref:Proline reductase-associated electron transfer protein PrdC n=2 Tax=Paramaledivibacter TaxID=1884934 RepID=A0A1M6LIJ9_PARC5|nr:proline reductase-associated electron transfer protein PrdC [Paramaledivibacter caminithermalis DSM 15212]